MKLYRFKNAIVEAEQIEPGKPLPPGAHPWPDEKGFQPRDMSLGYIDTKEYRAHLFAGDWVVKGANGEMSVGDSYLFTATYEPLTAPSTQTTTGSGWWGLWITQPHGYEGWAKNTSGQYVFYPVRELAELDAKESAIVEAREFGAAPAHRVTPSASASEGRASKIAATLAIIVRHEPDRSLGADPDVLFAGSGALSERLTPEERAALEDAGWSYHPRTDRWMLYL